MLGKKKRSTHVEHGHSWKVSMQNNPCNYPFTPKLKNCILPTLKSNFMSKVARICSIIIFDLSKL